MVWDFHSKEKEIYLTFDDGPTPEITEYVLDQLDQYKAKATFFCIGKEVEKHPGIYQEILRRGHLTGNHTYTHFNGWQSEDKAYFEDIRKAEPFIDSNLFRPPYGRIKITQINEVRKKYEIIMWDVISGDFDQKITPEKCLSNVFENAREGSIIVFHDTVKAAERMQYALPKVLQQFAEKGFAFKTIPNKNEVH